MEAGACSLATRVKPTLRVRRFTLCTFPGTYQPRTRSMRKACYGCCEISSTTDHGSCPRARFRSNHTRLRAVSRTAGINSHRTALQVGLLWRYCLLFPMFESEGECHKIYW